MNALIFDTETTGLPDFKLPVNHPSQPYIVQLAAILADEKGDTVSEMNVIIKPDNWSVPTAAAAVHGIPTERAEKYGIPIGMALHVFKELYDKADYLVAHNIDFDYRMLRRYYPDVNDTPFHRGVTTLYDTKLACSEVCQLELSEKQKAAQARHATTGWSPNGGWPKYKDPTMGEAFFHFFGEELDGAHNAMVDTEACKDVFFELAKLGLPSRGIYRI